MRPSSSAPIVDSRSTSTRTPRASMRASAARSGISISRNSAVASCSASFSESPASIPSADLAAESDDVGFRLVRRDRQAAKLPSVAGDRLERDPPLAGERAHEELELGLGLDPARGAALRGLARTDQRNLRLESELGEKSAQLQIVGRLQPEIVERYLERHVGLQARELARAAR